MIKIAPSILSADFSCLKEQISEIEKGGAKYVHIDVMDGMFVPNITMGPVVIESIRKHTDLVFDVHLMIEEPERYIKEFAEAGADIITVHIEATKDIRGCIEMQGLPTIRNGSRTNVLHIVSDRLRRQKAR